MIEVEIRGVLTKEKFDELNVFLSKNAEVLEVQDREMILLRDTPRYNEDPTLREVDIRIRRTNGNSEIMVKEMKSEHNVARSEKAYNFGDTGIEEMKEFVKFFGSKKGQWMHRKKTVYKYQGLDWSLVEAVPEIFYFEVEKEIESTVDIETTRQDLEQAAKEMDLSVLSSEEYKSFIKTLGERVNKYIEW